jgi:hypothetical protein
MTVVIDGTNGVSGVDGTASNPSYEGTDSNTGIFFPAADTIAFAEGGTEVARFDSSGNFGIGTSSPTSLLDVRQSNPTRGIVASIVNSATSSQTGSQLRITQAGIEDWVVGQPAATNAFSIWSGRSSSSDGTERMRIDSSGNLGLGVAPTPYASTSRVFQIDGGANASEFRLTNNATGAGAVNGGILQLSGTEFYIWNVENNFLSFGTNNTERVRIASVGDMQFNTTSQFFYTNNIGAVSSAASILVRNSTQGVQLTANATSWTSASDERLKTDLAPITNATEKVQELRAVTGRYKTDDEQISRAFVIAQDVQRVLPQAVTEIEQDGEKYLGLQYTDLIPLLTAAIQELKAELDATKAEVALLKGAA